VISRYIKYQEPIHTTPPSHFPTRIPRACHHRVQRTRAVLSRPTLGGQPGDQLDASRWAVRTAGDCGAFLPPKDAHGPRGARGLRSLTPRNTPSQPQAIPDVGQPAQVDDM
jgi:hypothetical protein